jgi:hypothetical protein
MSCPGDNYIVPGANPCNGGGGGGGGVNSVSSGTGILITGPSTDPVVACTIIQTPRSSYIIYVSPNGNDTTADGSLTLPFLKIQAAINFRASISNLINVEIFILPGTYPESLTITQGNTYLNANPSQYRNYKNVIISGTLVINVNDITSLNSVEVGIQNIQFLTANITTNSTNVNEPLYVLFTSCSISGYAVHNTNVNPALFSPNLVQYTDCWITNTTINPVITNNGCLMKILRTEINNGNSLTTAIAIAGSLGVLDIQYSSVTNSSNSSISPCVTYTNTGASTGNITAYNIFRHKNVGVDTGTNKCSIQYNQTGLVIDDFVGGNNFICPGALTFSIQKKGTGDVTFTVLSGNYAINVRDPAIGVTYLGGIIS